MKTKFRIVKRGFEHVPEYNDGEGWRPIIETMQEICGIPKWLPKGFKDIEGARREIEIARINFNKTR